MARDTRRAFGLRAMGAIASTFVGLAVAATPALAATVSGTDSFVSAGQSQLTVLTVDGSAGETIYVRVTCDGKVIADRLEYTLAEAQGAVSLDFSRTTPYDPSHTYEVSAYASRSEGEAIYTGIIQPIYATLAGGGRQLIAVSTKGEAEADRAFEAPAEITVGEDRVFTLAQAEDGSYSYSAADSSANVTGTLSYVADDGTVVAQTTVDGITPTQGQVVDVAATVQAADGTFYRVVRYSNTVTLTYLMNNATVRVKPAEVEDGFYEARVQYVDESGNVILTDRVSVTKRLMYSPERYLFTTGANGSEVYELTSAETVVFEPGDELSQSDSPVATITYRKVATEGSDAEALPLSFVVENIGTGLTDNRRVTLAEPIPTQMVKPGETYTYTAEEVYVDTEGNRYVSVLSSYSYSYDRVRREPVCTVYVAPEGYDVSLDPYDVTVEYRDIATGKVVTSYSVAITETNADTEIRFPLEPEVLCVQDGVTYVALKGYGWFTHNYFSANRTYTVWCRDVNDVEHENTTVQSVIGAAGDGSGDAADGTGAATTDAAGVGVAADGTTVVGLPDGTLTSIDGGDGTGNVLTADGQDVDSVRIDDEANPLAGPGGLAGASAALQSSTFAALAGALSAVLILFVVAFKRRKENETENAETDGEVK